MPEPCQIRPVRIGTPMIESLVTVAASAVLLMAALIVVSRVIPDEYDPAQARSPGRPADPPKA